MNILYSAVLLLVSGCMYGYWYTNPDFEPSSKYWIQCYVSLVAGLVLLGVGLLPKLKTFKLNLPKVEPVKESSDQIFQPQKFEEHDFSCLVHLRNRVQKAGSKDGLATVEKLAAVIFSLGKKD